MQRRISFPPAKKPAAEIAYSAESIFPIRVDAIPPSGEDFSVVVTNATGDEVARRDCRLVPLSALDSQVSVRDGSYVDAENRRTFVLIAPSRWQDRRKWASLRLARRWHGRRTTAPVLVGSPMAPVSGRHATLFPQMISGLVHDDDALSGPDAGMSVLWLPINLNSMPATNSSRNVLLSLPPSDLRARLPAEDVVRSLAAATKIIRERRPGASVTFLTPLPLVGEESLSSAYAAVVRRAARQCQAFVLDLHAAMREVPSWHRFFATDGVVHHSAPLAGGQAFIAERIGKHVDRPVIPAPGGLPVRPEIAATLPGGARPDPAISEEAVPRLEMNIADISHWHAVGCTPSLPLGTGVNGASLSIHPEFPGVAAVWRQQDFKGSEWVTVTFDVYVGADAAKGLKVSLSLKDKDGIWFQATSATELIGGRWNTLDFDLSADSPEVSSRGTQAAWGDHYRQNTSALGIRFFSPHRASSPLHVRGLRLEGRAARPSPRIIDFTPGPAEVRLYGKFESSFRIAGTAGLNPFDPDDIAVVANFVTPSGALVPVDAFFYQRYRRALVDDVEQVEPVGMAGWKLRFTPTEVGDYTYTLSLTAGGHSVTGSPMRFACTPSSGKGFIGISQSDPRFFAYANDELFYPIGQNIHAPFDKRAAEMLRTEVLPNRGTYAYDHYFKKMAEAGENMCVVWLAPWWLEFEWSADWRGHGGMTSFHLGRAWQLDRLLAEAERHGIVLQLVLENHGKYSRYVDSQWPSNPYNRANGGILRTPEEFFDHSWAERIYLKKLRYLIARWAHSTSLFGLELFGELNLVGNTHKFKGQPAHARWHERICRYIKAIDPYGHPLSTHYSDDWTAVDPKVAALPELDYVVGDAYKAGGTIAPLIVETFRENSRYGKPTFSSEYGGNWNGTTPARLEADLHAGLWANYMTQSAGAPLFWWYDFIDRYDLYFHMAALVKFSAGEDNRGSMETQEITVAHPGKRRVAALMLKRLDQPVAGRTAAFLWVYDVFAMEIMPEITYAPLIADGSVPLDLAAGEYSVEFWDTYGGAITETREVSISEGSELALPKFKRDIAMKFRWMGPRDHGTTGQQGHGTTGLRE